MYRLTRAAPAVLLLGILASCVSTGGSSSVDSSCEPLHDFGTVKDGFLTVGVTPNYAPYSYLEDQVGKGVDNEIVNKIADRECLEVRWTEMSGSAAIPALQQGRFDVLTGDWYRSAERAKVVGMSFPLYLDQMALISADGYSKISELEGKDVGTIDGYLWNGELQSILGDRLSIYPSPVNVMQDLESGRIEVGVNGYGAALNAVEKSGSDLKVKVAEPDPRVDSSVRPAQAGLLYSKDNHELGSAVDDDVRSLHKNGFIADELQDAGLRRDAADVGKPRLVE